MDNQGEQNPPWPGTSQQEYPGHEVPVYGQGAVTIAAPQPGVSGYSNSQAPGQSFANLQPSLVQASQAVASYTTVQLADSQFQQLTNGAFQPVYQANTVGYDRSSPIDDFPNVSHSAVLQQQLHTLQTDGRGLQRPQLITVPLMLAGLPQQSQGGVSSSAASLVTTMAASSLGLDTSAGMHGAATTTTYANVALHREQAISQSAESSRDQELAHQAMAPLFQVITSGYNQAEAASSEATPLIVHGTHEAEQTVSSLSLALQQQAHSAKRMPEDFEPDTTQQDSPYPNVVQETSEVYGDPEAGHYMEAEAKHHLDTAGLDSTSDNMVIAQNMARGHMDRAPTMDNNLDSTVEDAALVHVVADVDVTHEDIDVTHADVDDGVDTSGQPGGEEDLAQMLGASGIRRVCPSSLMVTQADLTIHAAQFHHPSHLHHPATIVHHQDPSLAGHHSNLVDAQEALLQEEVEEEDEDSAGDGDKENQMDGFAPRKSTRIALRERSPSPVIRPKYVPKPYSTHELWCEDCQTTYPGQCPEHKPQSIFDKVVLSRAWSSLPPHLQIFRLGDTTNLGIFARKNIPKRTQFGPYVADLCDSAEQITNVKFKLLVDRETEPPAYYDPSDENKCNWMIFVRPAESYAEQNLAAYQYGTDIYFSAIKHIEPRQELKVWYAAPYAARLGMATHTPSEEEREAMEEADLKWPCYECHRKFKTSTLLQKHLTVHDETVAGGDDDDTYEGERRVSKRPRRRLKSLKGKKKGRPAKKIREIVGEENVFQSWKKKKTNMYLNKLKKYREPVKRSIKTLYKKTGKDSGGNEWTCIHCDLTFDNASVLNLHTLTHAAEDVGLEELRRLTGGSTVERIDTGENVSGMEVITGMEMANTQFDLDESNLVCPVCEKRFLVKQDLIQHASEHAKMKRKHLINPSKPYKCNKCWKAFSVEDRLQKHMLCHGDEESKPLQCTVCYKRFMNNSALACHLKTHSDKKYYECPICHEGFDQVHVMRSHTQTHAVNGVYHCPDCEKQFDDYNQIRKHMRALHSEKQYPCPDCTKVFPRPDKLKLHMLKHSSHREFMCETCGRQFKRKDKLKEHLKRIHGPGREEKAVHRPIKPGDSPKKFVPKVSPSDYHRFIYKCHTCLLGFKRRGMLVNHLAKRHPDVKPDSVPELNLPILRTQRDYYCQYCEKVYKSSSKRKAHILKNHPGAELPPSSRKKGEFYEIPGLPNPTFSQTVGSVTTIPHACEYCHKQYASKAKLLQHQRKKHHDMVPPSTVERRKPVTAALVAVPGGQHQQVAVAQMHQEQPQQQILIQTDNKTKLISVPAGLIPMEMKTGDTVEVTTLPQVQGVADHALPATDLLTQAMSELTQTFQEYRTQEVGYQQIARLAPAAVPVANVGQQAQVLPAQHSTIQLSDLGQTLQFQAAPPPQGQMVESPGPPGANGRPLSPQPQQITVVSTSQADGQVTAQTFTVPRTWTGTQNQNTYQIYR